MLQLRETACFPEVELGGPENNALAPMLLYISGTLVHCGSRGPPPLLSKKILPFFASVRYALSVLSLSLFFGHCSFPIPPFPSIWKTFFWGGGLSFAPQVPESLYSLLSLLFFKKTKFFPLLYFEKAFFVVRSTGGGIDGNFFPIFPHVAAAGFSSVAVKKLHYI